MRLIFAVILVLVAVPIAEAQSNPDLERIAKALSDINRRLDSLEESNVELRREVMQMRSSQFTPQPQQQFQQPRPTFQAPVQQRITVAQPPPVQMQMRMVQPQPMRVMSSFGARGAGGCASGS